MADVKFSELTTLAAADVATDDIFAVVDTSATTSKKLTVANLLGQVPSGAPLHINDTTDSTSGTSGAISTDGGLGVTLKSFLNGEVTVATGIVADAQDGAYLGSSTKQFSDLFLADAGTITLGDDGDTVLTHVADTGVLLNSTRQLQFGDAGTYIHQSADGVLDLVSDTELELNATTIDVNGAVDIAGATITGGALLPSASGTIDLGSASAEFNDAFFSTGSVLNFGDGQEVTITAATTGLTINTDKELHFRDAGIYIESSVDGQLDAIADGEIELTAPIVDIDASTGIALDGANLNSNWLVNTTNQIRFHDTGQHISAPADGRLAVVSDGDIELTATDIKVGLAGQDANIQALTDAYDLTLKQYDGNEVARVFDGGKALPTYATLVQTAKGGFGYRKSVIAYTADSSSNVLQLTAALSGSVILVDCNSYSGGIKLPACATAAEAGMHFEFYLTAANSGTTTFYIETAGADGNDEITGYLHNPAQTSAGADITVDTAGDRLTLIASTGLGAHVSVTCMVGHGTTERWVAHAYVPTDHVPTIAD